MNEIQSFVEQWHQQVMEAFAPYIGHSVKLPSGETRFIVYTNSGCLGTLALGSSQTTELEAMTPQALDQILKLLKVEEGAK